MEVLGEDEKIIIELPHGHPLHREEHGDQYVISFRDEKKNRVIPATKFFFLEIYTLKGEILESFRVKLAENICLNLGHKPDFVISPWCEQKYNFYIYYRRTQVILLIEGNFDFIYPKNYTGFKFLRIGCRQLFNICGKHISENLSPRGCFALVKGDYVSLIDGGRKEIIRQDLGEIYPAFSEIKNMKFDVDGKLFITVVIWKSTEKVNVFNPDLTPFIPPKVSCPERSEE